MHITETFIDLLRGLHLVCFAAGMGTSLYFDFRTLSGMRRPVTDRDLALLNAIHNWVTFAFVGLWISGIGLVYVRTGFVLESFSPKLWTKLMVMSLMVMNAVALARIVFPVLRDQIGSPLLMLPLGRLSLITQIACNSLFCWTMGVSLGASTVLKTAQWDLLVPLGVGAFVTLSVGGHVVVGLMRWQHRGSTESPMEIGDVA